MARVTNFRKLKFSLFSEAPQLETLQFLHLFLPVGDRLSSALVRKFWTVGLAMPAALEALSWAHGVSAAAACLENALLP